MTDHSSCAPLVRLAATAALVGLALTACSAGSEDSASSSEAPPTSAAATSSAAPTESASEEPETILAVLCDEATPEQVAAVEAALKPEFEVSQLIDVRTDDAGMHAILGFVQGPGLTVLAQWTGTGLTLEGLAAADELAAQASNVPQATPDAQTQDLLGQTSTCYTTLFAPDDGADKKKKKDKDSE
jgi:hypothetical protein